MWTWDIRSRRTSHGNLVMCLKFSYTIMIVVQLSCYYNTVMLSFYHDCVDKVLKTFLP
jgi:hypothetical protein